MAIQYRLTTDEELQEAIDKQLQVRIFKGDLLIEARAVIVRYDDRLIVTQSGVSDLGYYQRADCECFALRRR